MIQILNPKDSIKSEQLGRPDSSSPVSCNNATIFLFLNSGRCANCRAAYTAAPEEIPASKPSVAASSRPARMASSSGTPYTSSTTEAS